MAIGDIIALTPGNGTGGRVYNVAASATLIYPGEPVAKSAVSDVVVAKAATNLPVVSSAAGVEGLFCGIAMTTSTNTASAAGTVVVEPVDPNKIYLIKPNSAAAWDTQAEYDALVGKRVLIDLTSTSYTILATDSAYNGCKIEALDISKYPGMVAFSFRAGASNQA